MRYAEKTYGEEPIAIGIFEPAASGVTITLVDLETDTEIPLTTSGCTESTVVSGFFYWHASGITTPLSGFHQCLYIMEDADGRQHAGKLVVGGYPSDSALRRYNEFIHIDVANGASGTDYPLGTPENPVNNVADARTIADLRNIPAFMVRGGITVSGDYADWTFEGIEPTDDTVTFLPGAVTSGCQFSQVGIRGTLSGAITAQECLYGTLGGTVSGLQGLANTCGAQGTLKIAGGFEALGLASQSLIPGTTLDLELAPPNTVVVTGRLTGVWNLANMGSAFFGASLDGGSLYLAPTCTAGLAYLYGSGEPNDQSNGTTVNDYVSRGSHLIALHDTDVPAVAADVERLYGRNTRTRLWHADAQVVSGGGANRNVPAGAVSHMETQVKTDAQADWASPTTYYVVFNYAATATVTTPPASAEPATSAPSDGSFSAEPYPA